MDDRGSSTPPVPAGAGAAVPPGAVTPTGAAVPPKGGVVREFLTGIGMLGRGLATYGTDFRLLALGLIPALLAGILLIGLLVVMIVFIDDLSRTVTWWADGWSSGARESVQIAAGLSLVGLFSLLAIVTFTSVTLAIGDPFYEKISERVEQRLDARGEYLVSLPTVELPWWKELPRGIAESIRMIAVSAAIGIPLFVCGFIPVVGQTAVPVIGALFGGWFLSVELVGVTFSRRGLRLRDRRRALRGRRAMAVGFGAAVFVCFLIPLGAILVTPAAVAGATILSRRVLATPLAAPASAPASPALPPSPH